MSTPGAADLTARLLARLGRPFAALSGVPLIGVAVSGGTDSTALLHLLVAWREQMPSQSWPRLHVLTVDHGLRPTSTAEAHAVVALAAKLGVTADVLTWTGAKPTSGLQAAARSARYALLDQATCAAAVAHGWSPADVALVTAHTADDQAETLLMRLARGSGPDGLACMRDQRALPSGLRLHRPLLGVTRADLTAYLDAFAVRPIDDPSNADARFERVRWRRALGDLAPLGLTSVALAATARRIGDAVDLIDALVPEVPGFDAAIQLDRFGSVSLDRAWLARHPPTLATHLLRRAIGLVGGAPDPVPLGALEAALEVAGPLATATHGFTLHGAEIDLSGAMLRVFREPLDARDPRSTLPYDLGALPLSPGAIAIWDRRFILTAAPNAPSALTIGPLGTDGLAVLDQRGWRRPDKVLAKILRTQPVLRCGDRLVAAPTLDIVDPDLHAAPATARLVAGTVLRPPTARVAAPPGA